MMRFFVVVLLLALTACSSEPGAIQTRLYAFGTEINISLYGVDKAQADKTLSGLEQTFSDVDNTWHAWRPSVLSDINNAITAGQTITVSNEVAELIQFANQLAQQSDHLFNPAAGQLFALWGFHQDDWFNSRPPPAQTDIDQWLTAAPSMADITIDNGQLHSDNPVVKLGFGGFAKGYAIDKAIAVLQSHGINNALVNIGGDLRAIGQHGERPWVIGVRHPRKDGMIATIAISGNESVFTSGDYERFFSYEGQRYPHILDPRTGRPATGTVSVTVLHDDASIADAAATALFVAGDDWPDIASKMGVSDVMLVKPDGSIEVSPTMSTRIKLLDMTHSPVVRTIDD